MSDEIINEVVTNGEDVVVIDDTVPTVIVEEEVLPATEVADILPTPDALDVTPVEVEAVKEEVAI